MRHLERARDLGGSQALGIGSDFEGIDFTIPDLDEVSDVPLLFTKLARRGWTEAELRALASENVLRVWDATLPATGSGSSPEKR